MGFAARRTERIVFSLVVAALVLCTESARAEERPLSEAVTLASADPCFALDALLEHLEAFLGRATIDAHLAAVVDVGVGTASFEVLRDGAPGGRRRFERLPRACEDRRAVVALALALALDESSQFAPSHAAAAAAPAQAVSDARPASAAHAGIDDASRSIGVELRVGGGVLLGALPAPAPIVAVDLSVTPTRTLSFGVGGFVTTEIDAAIGRGVARADVVGGRVSACLEREVGRDVVSLAGCLAAWLGAVRAHGDGFAADREGTAPWLAVVARAQLDLRATDWLSLFAAVDGMLVPLAPALEVAGGDTVVARVDLGRAGVALSVGLALSL